MARSSADDAELRRAVAAAVSASGSAGEEILFSIRVAKGRGMFEKLGRLAKPRVLAVTTQKSSKGQKTKGFLRVLKDSGAVLEPAKLYRLNHLTKVEVVANDPTGLTFTLGFDNLRTAPSQWTMRNIDDRNRLLLCIINLCKESLNSLPKIVGIDIVELALWAEENTPTINNRVDNSDGQLRSSVVPREMKITVEKDLMSQAKEEEQDMEALLGTYVMGIGEAQAFSDRMKQELVALEAANVYQLIESEPIIEEVLHGLGAASTCIDDINEWLGIFNVKLRHMREDIASIESRNNNLEMQSKNYEGLLVELNEFLERLRIRPEHAASLTAGSFHEDYMLKNIEACEWLTGAIRSLEVPNLDPRYANMQAVKEKRAELKKLQTTFVKLASNFLSSYFAKVVDMMISDKSYFSQRGQLKRPDHADLRYKCRTYARLLQYLKSLDKSCLVPIRKAYCQSLNLLFRREAREFANELRASTKVQKGPGIWLEGSNGSPHDSGSADTSAVSEAYSKMLTIFIPLLVDESSFFAQFMCFELPSLVPVGSPAGSNRGRSDDNGTSDVDSSVTDPNGNNSKLGSSSSELGSLNEALQELLDGIQEDFYAVVDWAYRADPHRCISMHGITLRYLSGQKADAAGFVRKLLDDLESKISSQFSKFVDETCNQIERIERNVRQVAVLPYMSKFAEKAAQMEQCIKEQSRELVDKAYMKIISAMFSTLEKIAQMDPKMADIVLIENYAAFQNSLYDLATAVPTLAKYYGMASDSYEQACTRHISSLINLQFDRLFQFSKKIEELTYTITAEEIPFQIGLSKADLRKILKSSFTGLDKSFQTMYRRLQRNLSSDELLPSLWEKCKKDFVDKYESFVQTVSKIYPDEPLNPVEEIKAYVASL